LITSDGKYKLCDFGSATTEIIPPNKSLNIQEIHKLEEEIQKYTTIQYRPPEMCDLYQRRGLNEKVDTWVIDNEKLIQLHIIKNNIKYIFILINILN